MFRGAEQMMGINKSQSISNLIGQCFLTPRLNGNGINPGEKNQSYILYSEYVSDEKYKKKLAAKLKEFIPSSLIQNIEEQIPKGDSWIIAYGYNEEPYCNKGGWGSTEPYPYLTSDGKSYLDLYVNMDEIHAINKDNFVTPFNKNKHKVMEQGNFVLDKNKRLYKIDYPDVEKYDHIFIKHIPSY